ncbi:MAG: (2Fe-2S)-binding protein [Afipia sp.]|jgi:carbon-monoxide dehydrogenase small subunit|nr:(2Fe-2S)-binding protein [Afipia sp.]
MSGKVDVKLTINGACYTGRVEPRTLLVDFIREEAGLTGTHVGCAQGVCGACTVLVGGQAARSCLLLVVQCEGEEIETVEGLGTMEQLSVVQHAFWEKHGLQCGFCTPGMLMTIEDLLRNNPSPDREEIREAISGNLCRCTGYQTIVDSVERAVELRKASGLEAAQ